MLEETKHFYKSLRQLAPILQECRGRDDAELRYDFMSDAVYWSDELPEQRGTLTFEGLRPVLRFRTSVLEGVPDAEYAELWAEARELFHEWIGFAPERNVANIALLRYLEQSRKRAWETFPKD